MATPLTFLIDALTSSGPLEPGTGPLEPGTDSSFDLADRRWSLQTEGVLYCLKVFSTDSLTLPLQIDSPTVVYDRRCSLQTDR
jgi:hypothetical protein